MTGGYLTQNGARFQGRVENKAQTHTVDSFIPALGFCFGLKNVLPFPPSLLLSSPLLFRFFSFFLFFFSPAPSSVLVPQQVVAGSSRILGD